MCKPGYFGTPCDTPCPSGSFGTECGGFCFPKCPNVTCHHVHGCPENTGNTLQTTISGTYVERCRLKIRFIKIT